MKFKVYNQANTKSTVRGTSILRVSEKAGLFTFSKAAGIVIGMQENDKICIMQDEDCPEDFYVTKNSGDECFKLRSKGITSFSFNCSMLSTLILDKGKVVDHKVNLNRSENFIVEAPQEIDGIIMHKISLSKPVITKLP